MSVLIYRSGKVVFTGGKSYEDFKSAAADVLPQIKKYYKFDVINFEGLETFKERALNNIDKIFGEIM